MSEVGYSIMRDLDEAQAMAKGLEAYVRGTNLYGSVGGGLFGSRMPSLTIGALLLRMRRLSAQTESMTPDQRDKLDKIRDQHDHTRREWRKHYDEKLTQEAFSRLKAMRTFFEECAERPRTCGGNYQPETLRRTIVQEIIETLRAQGQPVDEIVTEAKNVDGRLRRFVQPAPFVWASGLEAVYPRDIFWWLYAKPPQVEHEK